MMRIRIPWQTDMTLPKCSQNPLQDRPLAADLTGVPRWYFRWWFQIFLIFASTWGDDPSWLIFFKWVETSIGNLECVCVCVRVCAAMLGCDTNSSQCSWVLRVNWPSVRVSSVRITWSQVFITWERRDDPTRLEFMFNWVAQPPTTVIYSFATKKSRSQLDKFHRVEVFSYFWCGPFLLFIKFDADATLELWA